MTSASIQDVGCPDRLDARRRRLLFRAWRRGTREMDLVLGRFAEARLATLAEPELDDLERLMNVPDQDLFAWISGAAPVAANFDTPVFRAMVAFHAGGRQTA